MVKADRCRIPAKSKMELSMLSCVNSILYFVFRLSSLFLLPLRKKSLTLKFPLPNNNPARNIKLILLHEYIVLRHILLLCCFFCYT